MCRRLSKAKSEKKTLEAVQRGFHAQPASSQDVSVNHRCRNLLVPQRLTARLGAPVVPQRGWLPEALRGSQKPKSHPPWSPPVVPVGL